PTEGPIAGLPRPTPGATATAQPPIVSTPRPTARPTPRPTPTPEPVAGKVHKPRPPCPGAGSGPPGHQKTAPPPSRPCGGGPKGGGAGGTGMVVILPLALAGLATSVRTRFLLGSRRLVRTARTETARRRRTTADRTS
ncbi:MAG TPA: hypothetical protein VN773_00155, partial [Verrucomicrobiae bacterium]|nr:hypothetical protein [Verrucomicrobiae bacterium]